MSTLAAKPTSLPPPIAPRPKKKSLDETAATATATSPSPSSSPSAVATSSSRTHTTESADTSTTTASATTSTKAFPPLSSATATAASPTLPARRPNMQAIFGGQPLAKAFATAISSELSKIRGERSEDMGIKAPGGIPSTSDSPKPRSPNMSPRANPPSAALPSDAAERQGGAGASAEADENDPAAPELDDSITEEERSRALTRFFSQKRQKSRDKVINEREMVYKEDIAEWFSKLFEVEITPGNLIENISNGVLMCRLAKLVSENMTQWRYKTTAPISEIKLPLFRSNAKVGSFLARDNVSQFIAWSKRIGTPCIFETNDLVEQTNIMQVLCCLMDLARGAPYLNFLPQLVQFELEIENQERSGGGGAEEDDEIIDLEALKVSAEENKADFLAIQEVLTRVHLEEQEASGVPDLEVIHEECDEIRTPRMTMIEPVDFDYPGGAATECEAPDQEQEQELPNDTGDEAGFNSNQYAIATPERRPSAPVHAPPPPTPPPKIDLIPIGKNKYLLGNTKLHIRMFRNHLVVRVGGGWDTLENYLKKRAAAQQTFGETMENEGGDSPSKALANAIKAEKQVVKRGRSEVGIAQVKKGQVMETFNINVSWEKMVGVEAAKGGLSAGGGLFPRSGSSISTVSATSNSSDVTIAVPGSSTDTQDSDATTTAGDEAARQRRAKEARKKNSQPTAAPPAPAPADEEEASTENSINDQNMSTCVEVGDNIRAEQGEVEEEQDEEEEEEEEAVLDASRQIDEEIAPEGAEVAEESNTVIMGNETDEGDELTEASAFQQKIPTKTATKEEKASAAPGKARPSAGSRPSLVAKGPSAPSSSQKPEKSSTSVAKAGKTTSSKAPLASAVSTPKAATSGAKRPDSAAKAPSSVTKTPSALSMQKRPASGVSGTKTPTSTPKAAPPSARKAAPSSSAKTFVAKPAPTAPAPESAPRQTLSSSARATSASVSRTGMSAPPSGAPSPARAKSASKATPQTSQKPQSASSSVAPSATASAVNSPALPARRSSASTANKRLSTAALRPVSAKASPAAATSKRVSSAGLAKK